MRRKSTLASTPNCPVDYAGRDWIPLLVLLPPPIHRDIGHDPIFVHDHAIVTLNYRSPDTPEHRVRQVMDELSQDEAIDWILGLFKVVLGLPLTLLPAWLVALRLSEFEEFPFLSTFVVLSALSLPVMIHFERRERQHFIWEAVRERFEMFLLDILLLGPRMLCSVYDTIVTSRLDPSQMALAAKIVVDLLDSGQTVEIGSLLTPDRSEAEVGDALRYLEARGWVLISHTRSRARLATSVRSQLSRF